MCVFQYGVLVWIEIFLPVFICLRVGIFRMVTIADAAQHLEVVNFIVYLTGFRVMIIM